MSGISFDLEALESGLTESGAMAGMLARGGNAVRDRAQQLVHVDTGNLQSSIRVDLLVDDKGPYARIGSFVPYALWQEIGTRRLTMGRGFTPYLRPALSAAGEGIRRHLSGAGQIPTGTPQ